MNSVDDDAVQMRQQGFQGRKDPFSLSLVNHISILSRIIEDHAPPGVTVTEHNLAEEIDRVVTHTLTRSWDNADARNRGARRATATVFRKFGLKPVGEPYDSTVSHIEDHYLVD